MEINELKAAVDAARVALLSAEVALNRFESLAENNVFANMAAAVAVEGKLQWRAAEDCEGSHSCGSPTYEQEFMLEGSDVIYVGVLTVQYNRHDKTYYYIDSLEFSIRVK